MTNFTKCGVIAFKYTHAHTLNNHVGFCMYRAQNFDTLMWKSLYDSLIILCILLSTDLCCTLILVPLITLIVDSDSKDGGDEHNLASLFVVYEVFLFAQVQYMHCAYWQLSHQCSHQFVTSPSVGHRLCFMIRRLLLEHMHGFCVLTGMIQV